jgi:hypothetical protein
MDGRVVRLTMFESEPLGWVNDQLSKDGKGVRFTGTGLSALFMFSISIYLDWVAAAAARCGPFRLLIKRN